MKGPFFAERDILLSSDFLLRCWIRRISCLRDLVLPFTAELLVLTSYDASR